jgi:hypothetical protein
MAGSFGFQAARIDRRGQLASTPAESEQFGDSAPGRRRSRLENDSGATDQDTGCLVLGASKSSRTLGVSG